MPEVAINEGPLKKDGEFIENKGSEKRRIQEISTVSKTLLRSKYKEKLLNPEGKQKKAETPEERALEFYHQLGHAENVSGQFPKGDGNDILLPKPDADFPDPHGGKAHKFGPQELRLASIVSSDKKGLLCTFDNSITQKPVVDSQGNPLQVSIPRDIVANAQLAAERKIYEGILENDQLKILGAYIDSLPQSGAVRPDQNIDPLIEKAADSAGLLTVTDIVKSSKLNGDDRKRLEGKVILTEDEYPELSKALGLNGVELDTKADALREEIAIQKKNVEDNSRDSLAQQTLDEKTAALEALGEIKSAITPRLEDGKSAVDDIFGKIQNGEMDPETAKGIKEAIKTDNPDAFFQTIAELQIKESMEQAEKDQIEEKRKEMKDKILKGTKVTGLSLGAILLLIAGGVAVGMIGAVAKSGGQR